MSPILGIWASQISGHLWAPAGAYDALATVTVPSGGTSIISFAGIPTGYKHLQIRALLRSNRADTGDDIKINFNDVTSASYSSHIISGYGGGVLAYGAGSNTAMYCYLGIPAANTAANIFDGMIIDILDYANTSKNKTMRILHGWDGNGSGDVELVSGAFYNTNAVTSISIAPRYGTAFAQYSQFALYGVK